MLISLSLLLLLGMALGYLCKRIGLPSLVGMIATGILLGPYALNLIDGRILAISSELRRIALIIILMRAGLSLDISGLRKVGRSAVLMCFLPATFEIAGYMLLAPRILSISMLDAAIMGSVLAAVSPAVVVPRMIHISESHYGTDKQIPQMILAGASVDDVFVIVMFSAFTGLATGNAIKIQSFINIPVSIAIGLLAGFTLGILLGKYFARIHMRDSAKVVILMAIAFLLDGAESYLPIPFAGLLAIMGMGIGLQKERKPVSERLSSKFGKLWVLAELMLFVLVGACIDIQYSLKAGPKTILLVILVLFFRMLGVFLCVLGTKLNRKEKLFCAFAYIPKATVQAAIGSVPLAMGLGCGEAVLTVAVIGILLTAPVGAFLIDHTYQRYLQKA